MLDCEQEQEAEMKRFRLVEVTLLAVCVLGLTVASVAQAETAPSYTIGGTRLVAGKTHDAEARVYNAHSFVLTNSVESVIIECKALGTEGAGLSGSNAGTTGSAAGVAVFSQCALNSGNGRPNCELANEAGTEGSSVIKTEPVKSYLVENVEAGHVGKRLLTLFVPLSKAKGFVTLHFRGTECIFKETITSGSVVGEVLLDSAAEGAIELGQTTREATSLLVRFPSTPITEVWLISGGVGKEVETGQVSFNTQSVQTGIELTLLASTKFAPEPNASWSALP